jgi:putative DNA methylase
VGRGAKFRCLVCGEVAPDQHLKDEGMAGHMGAQLMATVTEGQNGRNYHAPTLEYGQLAVQAQPPWEPVGELADDARAIWCKLYGLIEFRDLFTPRQLVALTTFSDLVAEAREQIRVDALAAGLPDDGDARGIARPLREDGAGARAYAEAISTYLACAVSRLTDYMNSLCTWNPTNQNISHLFQRQGIPMAWDFAEANALGDKLNITTATGWICEALKHVPGGPLRAHALQLDATKAQPVFRSLPVISTDPPYYDNISYADLADFFYVWLRPALQDIYPDVFSTVLTPKAQELIASPHRHKGSAELAETHFREGSQLVFERLRSVANPEWPITVYYAFKEQEAGLTVHDAAVSTGWDTMLSGLIAAGFQITATCPVRTTKKARAVARDTNALASAVVIAARPRPDEAPMASRRDFLAALRRELPPALLAMQTGNIAPVDLAQASIGPGMAVYSRYGRVLEANGEPLTVRTALQLINQELDAYLAEQEGHLDADTRFAVAWFEQHGFREGEFGVADVLARAKGTAVDRLARTGLLVAGAGKVRLVGWQELDPGEDPTNGEPNAWLATHHLVERLNSHGETGAAELLARMPAELAADARQLAYRLYALCERKGWADLARDYNALVVSWGASQEQAAGIRQRRYEQGQMGL